MEKVKDIKKDNRPSFIPYTCPKCKTGKWESQCDGRVYICSNPNCKVGMWVTFKENDEK